MESGDEKTRPPTDRGDSRADDVEMLEKTFAYSLNLGRVKRGSKDPLGGTSEIRNISSQSQNRDRCRTWRFAHIVRSKRRLSTILQEEQMALGKSTRDQKSLISIVEIKQKESVVSNTR